MNKKLLVATSLAAFQVTFQGLAQIVLSNASVYTQDFDSLSNTTASSTVPSGWAFSEAGANVNTTYSVGTGSGTAGDTYSFGAASSTDRAFGTLLSGTLTSTIGAQFSNGNAFSMTQVVIGYTGEQWRLGVIGRADRLDFQYSLDATSLTTGTWTDANGLDFSSPFTTTAGALDGNAAANRTVISPVTITFSSPVAANGVFWIRWTDLNATGADDGLAVDAFTAAVPEPSEYAAMAGAGLIGFAIWRRRMARKA
jgi:hypothetical protein